MKRNASKRDTILNSALELFNQKGTGPVTTNHIAKSAEVSPGNLYYHFRNKEEIIRELYEQFRDEYGAVWHNVFDGPFDAEAILNVVVAGFDINAKYRFIALELVALCRHDPMLMARQRESYTEHFTLIQELVRRAIESGVFIEQEDDRIYDDTIHMIWLINQYWLSYVHLQSDTPDAAMIRRGVRLSLRAIEPYLHPAFRKIWKQFF